jgi:Lrp/AsnC family leucine-responsive transcriptional regulator
MSTILDPKMTPLPDVAINVNTAQLDATDLKLLELLQSNARLSNVELAERVGLSPSPCLRRIRILEEKGVIEQYSALLDPLKLSFGLEVFISAQLNQQDNNGELSALLNDVQDWPEVLSCFAMTGGIDYMFHIYCHDMAHFSDFLMNTLLQYPAVKDVKSSFVLKSFKRNRTFPLKHLEA